MSFDVSNDWLLFDWIESISYFTRQSDTEYSSAQTAMALKREDKKEYVEDSFGGELAKHEVKWEVFVTSMSPTFIPLRGDYFTADTVTGTTSWQVEAVDYCDKTSRYRLWCKQKDNNG